MERMTVSPSGQTSTDSFNTFFEATWDNRMESARIVLGPLWDWLSPRTVLDVGCGPGAWMRVASDMGAREVFGMDAPGIDTGASRLPPEAFREADLSQPFDLGRRFDLVVSLEVAEHLPPERAEGFVADLTAHGDVVLFSAAVPLQGGSGHINEQFQDYWAGLFREAGYVAVDAIRPLIWTEQKVFWWVRQNAILYVTPDVLSRVPALRPFVVEDLGRLVLIHPDLHLLMARRLGALAAAQSR